MSELRYYGKYRGVVYRVNDPEHSGRIICKVPSVFGDEISGWCTPCIPCAFDNGGDFFLPKIGDTVWVEFEEGKPNLPIWTGNWFSTNKTPINTSYNTAPNVRVISWGATKITLHSNYLTINQGGNVIELNIEDVKFLSRISAKDLSFIALNADAIKNMLDKNGGYRYWNDDKR